MKGRLTPVFDRNSMGQGSWMSWAAYRALYPDYSLNCPEYCGGKPVNQQENHASETLCLCLRISRAAASTIEFHKIYFVIDPALTGHVGRGRLIHLFPVQEDKCRINN